MPITTCPVAMLILTREEDVAENLCGNLQCVKLDAFCTNLSVEGDRKVVLMKPFAASLEQRNLY